MPEISPQSVPIMEGAALLVRRPNTPRWQVKYKVANHWMRTSTKTADLDEARKAAVEIVLDAMHKEKFGLPIVTRSFKSIANTAIKRMEKELDEGQAGISRDEGGRSAVMIEISAREVIVYVTPLCSPCERLKAYLRSRDVVFQVKDLMMDADAAERLKCRGVRGSPALEVDGEIVAGPALDNSRIDAMLGL